MAKEQNSFRDIIHEKLQEKYSKTEVNLKNMLEDIGGWQFTSKYRCPTFVVSRINPDSAGAWKDAAKKLGFMVQLKKSKVADAGEGAKDLIVFDKSPRAKLEEEVEGHVDEEIPTILNEENK